MRKVLAFLLAITMMIPLTTVATANTTTLTTTVPAASYTLNVPANQAISYGSTRANIGGVSITDSDGFAVGKNLNIYANCTAFTCPDVSTTIPFDLKLSQEDYLADASSVVWEESTVVCFKGKADDTVSQYPYVNGASQWSQYLFITIDSADWGKALAGEYSATITFTTEVVVEE